MWEWSTEGATLAQIYTTTQILHILVQRMDAVEKKLALVTGSDHENGTAAVENVKKDSNDIRKVAKKTANNIIIKEMRVCLKLNLYKGDL